VGSVLGYSLFVYALRHLPAQQVSVYAYVNPLIALLTGNLLMDEPVSGKTLFSMGVVLAGVFLVNEGMRRMRKTAQS
jgi:drug/metabolite transporter (DMT)-like permease